MARDYVEIIHSPQLPWQSAPAAFAGAHRTVTAWGDEKHPVLWNPPHRPVLPPEFAAAGAQPVADPLEY